MTVNIEILKNEVATRKRQRLSAALAALTELQQDSSEVIHCVHDCNGEPDNGWKPDLVAAHMLTNRAYWKIVRVHNLLEGKDTGGADIEIALWEERLGEHAAYDSDGNPRVT
jgi:hypothetical protein